MGHFGAGELIIIAVLVIVIFGGRKLPELGKGLGQGLANFRRAMNEPDSTVSRKADTASNEPSAKNTENTGDKSDNA